MEQHYNNHRRFNRNFHFIFVPTTLICIGIAINEAIKTPGASNYIMIVTLFLVLSAALFGRIFALRAQDRAIRAEESLRYYILTGKMLPKELRLGQIIALRFAHDDEFVALVDRAVKEQLKSKNIKQLIAKWRGDHHRV